MENTIIFRIQIYVKDSFNCLQKKNMRKLTTAALIWYFNKWGIGRGQEIQS